MILNKSLENIKRNLKKALKFQKQQQSNKWNNSYPKRRRKLPNSDKNKLLKRRLLTYIKLNKKLSISNNLDFNLLNM